MNDFSNLNHLPTEVKQLIVNAQVLLDEAKATLQNRDYRLDLTSKAYLKSECKEVEKYIKLISKGKALEKNVKHLEVLNVRLRTTLDGLISFFTR